MKFAMLQTILLVTMILISVVLTGLVLMQRSEGGALGMGGGPSGFMSARGAGNLLTTLTWWFGTAFAVLAVGLTIVGNMERSSRSILNEDTVEGIDLDAQAPASADPAAAPAPVTPAPAQDTAPTLDDLSASLGGSSTAPAQPAPAQ